MRFWSVVKVAAAVVTVCFGFVAADRYEGVLRRKVFGDSQRVNSSPLPLGEEIASARERQYVNKVSADYGRVKVAVDAARAKGANVDNLDKMLLYSLTLAREKKYEMALTLINRIEMDIPRPKEHVVAARLDDPLPPEPEIKTKPVARKAPPARRRRGGSR